MRKRSNKVPEKNEHPEISEVKNICIIAPDNKNTKSVCDVVKKDHQANKSLKEIKPPVS